MKFSIRDLLWFTVVAALAISWWIDNKRIETTVKARDQERSNLADDRRLLQAEFNDKLAIAKDLQRQAEDKLPRVVRDRVSPSVTEKYIDTRKSNR